MLSRKRARASCSLIPFRGIALPIEHEAFWPASQTCSKEPCAQLNLGSICTQWPARANVL
jgi:hypothetical protein